MIKSTLSNHTRYLFLDTFSTDTLYNYGRPEFHIGRLLRQCDGSDVFAKLHVNNPNICSDLIRKTSNSIRKFVGQVLDEAGEVTMFGGKQYKLPRLGGKLINQSAMTGRTGWAVLQDSL